METVTIAERRAVKRNCPLCGEDSASAPRNRYSDTTWIMKSCPDCKFVYLDYAPVYEELMDEYAWEKTATLRNKERKNKHPLLSGISKGTRWRLHLFKRNRVEDIVTEYVSEGNIIDIGCGSGEHLKKLRDTYVPFGIEISRGLATHAVEYAGKRGGRVIIGSALEGLQEFPENFAGGIFMRAFLEHEANPGGVLEQVHRVLRPDGVVIIKVPNFGCVNRIIMGRYWSGFRFPDHLNYFTPRTLRRLCLDCGLVVRRFGIMDRLSLRDNMWLIAGKNDGGCV